MKVKGVWLCHESTRGNSFCDVKRKPYKCSSRKRESIEAREGGGPSRISDEDAVMVLERRGCCNLYKSMDNQKWEEPLSRCIVAVSRGIANRVVRSRMSREFTYGSERAWR